MEYSTKKENGKDMMPTLGLCETIDQLAMASSVHWNGHALWMEDSHVLRRELELDVKGQRKKW